MIDHRVIGEAVRECREIRGMTQNDVSEQTGLTINYLSLLENGHRGAGVDTLNTLAGVLHVPTSVFYVLAEKAFPDGEMSRYAQDSKERARRYIDSKERARRYIDSLKK